jgi:hypothetical protein
MDILLGPDVFVNASVARGSAPEQVVQRVLGKKSDKKPPTTDWVMARVEAMLRSVPSFKADAVAPQMKLISDLLELTKVEAKVSEDDWVKGLVASAKATKRARVVTDHPDLADKTEVDGIQFLSSEAWLVEQTTPPPPPPKKKA